VPHGGETSDIINIGGVKVSARRIEELLEAMEEVHEAAGCGIEDASGVERAVGGGGAERVG